MAENPEETDVSLPPADEQRITPPLTDEELAEILELAEDTPGHTVVLFRSDVFRLIADLRAKNAEVESLWEAVNSLWGWMGVDEVNAMREDDPVLVELARYAHQRTCHKEESD